MRYGAVALVPHSYSKSSGFGQHCDGSTVLTSNTAWTGSYVGARTARLGEIFEMSLAIRHAFPARKLVTYHEVC